MVGTADIHTAIVTLWKTNGLDEKFKSFWNTSINQEEFIVLVEGEASPRQPFPYCVFETTKPNPIVRMSGKVGLKQELRNTTLTFSIYTEKDKNNYRTAKQIAAYLMEEILKVFGGHPTQKGQRLELVNGGVLPSKYSQDYSMSVELYKHCWIIEYNLLLDIPVAI